MISNEDSYYTYEYSDYFKILPQINNWNKDKVRIRNGRKVSEGFTYSSNNNSEWMSKNNFKVWLDSNKHNIGKI